VKHDIFVLWSALQQQALTRLSSIRQQPYLIAADSIALNQNNLTWTDYAVDETDFSVERRPTERPNQGAGQV
jgi:hypothetical protein